MEGLSILSPKILRFLVGYVFGLVGVLKWINTDFGHGFAQIGIPFPEISVLIIGGIEVICGSLILFNLYVRKAFIPLFIIMIGAISLTKIPILIGKGFLEFAFEARLDVVMIGILIVLWIEYNASFERSDDMA